jgi:hypothetical protein
MASEPTSGRPERVHERRSVKNRLLLYALVLLAVFLLGFLPQYINVNRLTQQVAALQWQNRIGTARDLIGLAFLEVSNNNFGVASSHASAFFTQLRALIDSAPEPAQREALQQLLSRQDSVISGLAKADPAVRTQLQEMMVQMHNQKGAQPQ